MSKVLGVIPARYDSSRFPGKPLAKIGSKPMIQWVYEAAKKCPEIDRLVVATDDERIREVVAAFGGEVLITSEDHKSGTDRVMEVSEYYGPDYQIVANIQGDEPGVEPELISGVIQTLQESDELAMSTGARPFTSEEEPLDPNRVKVTISKKKRALYFSRSLIPFPRNNIGMPVHLHLGIYAYKRDFLLRFNTLPKSDLEDTESLEQLRAIENDFPIGVHIVEHSMPGVDTPGDLSEITGRMREKGYL